MNKTIVFGALLGAAAFMMRSLYKAFMSQKKNSVADTVMFCMSMGILVCVCVMSMKEFM